jgi:hypothetical protein
MMLRRLEQRSRTPLEQTSTAHFMAGITCTLLSATLATCRFIAACVFQKASGDSPAAGCIIGRAVSLAYSLMIRSAVLITT